MGGDLAVLVRRVVQGKTPADLLSPVISPDGVVSLKLIAIRHCQTASNIDPRLECAPWGGQFGRFELTPLAGLPENGSHDEASITQRRVQAAGG